MKKFSMLFLTIATTLCLCLGLSACALWEYELSSDGTSYTVTGADMYIGTELVIPSEYKNLPVTAIGSSAFKGASLEGITIPDSVTSIGEDAFYHCTSLISVTIGNGVTSIDDDAFYGCSSLISITIPDSVTSIGNNAFYGCTSLESLTIGSGVTSIGNNAFYGCTSLTSVTIGSSGTSIGSSAFYNTGYYNDSNNWEDSVLYIGKCLIKAETSLSKSYSIKSGTTVIADEAFYGCESLEGIEIPDSVKVIGECAFSSCTSLEIVKIGSGLTSIGQNAFYDTEYYNGSYNWKDGVLYIGQYLIKADTSISESYSIKSGTTVIADWAFNGTDSVNLIEDINVHSITIPNSVTNIGEWAFYACHSLTSVTFADPSGWYVFAPATLKKSAWYYSSTSSTAKNGGELSSADLADPATAAEYLRSTYAGDYWYKK